MLIKTVLILNLAAITGAYAMSHKPATEQVPAIQASKIKITDFKTKQGIPVWLVENQDIPVLSLSICFKNAGSKTDPLGKIGLTNFLAQILSEGCGDLNNYSFKKYLLEHNINLSISQTVDDFIFEFRAPKHNIKAAFDAIKWMLTKPGFSTDAMERVKQQLLTVLHQSLHSEKAMAANLKNQRAYPGHPYGRSIEENISDLPSITSDDLKKYMAENFSVDQLIITASGAIDQTQLSIFLDETMNSLSQKTAQPVITKVIDPVSPGTIFVKEMDIPQSAILFFQPSLSRQDPDFYAAMVMIKILGDDIFDSRLGIEVREKRGLAYGLNTLLSWNAQSSSIIGSTATQNSSVTQVIQIIKEQWELIKKNGITAEELAFTKEKMIGTYPLAFGTTFQITGMLRRQQLDGMDSNFVNERNNLIQKVTLEDVNRVAKKLINPEKLTFIVVGKPDGLKTGESK